MTTIADLARASALQVEAKKHALRQQQDGCWILTLKVHQHDMPQQIMTAAMGARYVMALVEIGDDEHPLPPHSAEAAPRPVHAAPQPLPVGENKQRRPMNTLPYPQQAALRCQDARFRAFLRETNRRFARDEEGAREYILEYCNIKSRADIKPGTEAETYWLDIDQAFDSWLTEDRAFA